jgi:hypothetical protein
LIVVAIGLAKGDEKGLFPAWFPLTVLGIIALFAGDVVEPAAPSPLARRKLPPPVEEEPSDDEPSDSNSSPSSEVEWEDGPFAQWLEEKRESERARRQESKQGEMADERRVDDILARLHEHGPQSLSADDRQVLHRVSERLRRRKQRKA